MSTPVLDLAMAILGAAALDGRGRVAMATMVSTARLVLEVTMATPRAAQNGLGLEAVVAWP